jgi:hypothetical protein
MAQPKAHSHPADDTQSRKDELIAELARARSGMALHGGQVRYQADVNRRLKASVKDNVGRWIAGALVTGGVISLLPMRERKVYVNPLSTAGKSKVGSAPKSGGGFWASFFKMLVPLIKPLLTAFVTKQLANVVGGAKEAQHTAEETAKVAEKSTREAVGA